VTPSSGNVFRDLGFSEEEAEHLVIRADLLIQIQKVVTARRLKQAPLAKLLQVSQPRVSDLLRGRLHLFSIETLIDMLGRLGVQVRLVVKPFRRRPESVPYRKNADTRPAATENRAVFRAIRSG